MHAGSIKSASGSVYNPVLEKSKINCRLVELEFPRAWHLWLLQITNRCRYDL